MNDFLTQFWYGNSEINAFQFDGIFFTKIIHSLDWYKDNEFSLASSSLQPSTIKIFAEAKGKSAIILLKLQNVLIGKVQFPLVV